MLVSNKFYVLSCPDNDSDLDIRLEGAYNDDDSDGITSKSDGEIAERSTHTLGGEEGRVQNQFIMSWLVWNIQGIHQKDSTNYLKDMIRVYDIRISILLEPKAAHSELPRFAFSMGFTSWLHDAEINSHIWILWKGF